MSGRAQHQNGNMKGEFLNSTSPPINSQIGQNSQAHFFPQPLPSHPSGLPPGLAMASPGPGPHHGSHPHPPTGAAAGGGPGALAPPPPHPMGFGESGEGSGNNGESFDVTRYVYNAGYIHAAWADTFLNMAPHPPLRLHALFLSRSPLLYRFLSGMSSHGPPYHINLPISDRNVTTAALSMVLAALYGRSLDLPNCDLPTAEGIIAAGSFLGLEELASSGYQALLNFVSTKNLPELFAFTFSNLDLSHSHNPGHSRSESHGHGSHPSSPPPSMGTSDTNEAMNRVTVGIDEIDPSYTGPYPSITSRLLTVLLDHILANLDASQKLDVSSEFFPIIQTLPFSLCKYICEHDDLRVGSVMARHSFAKSVVAVRDQYRKKHAVLGKDETVVLAFSGGKQAVQVIRKNASKRKSLWKASQ